MGSKKIFLFSVLAVAFMAFALGCTQEAQNKINRSIQNWTGVDGVIDVFSGGKLVMRFMKID